MAKHTESEIAAALRQIPVSWLHQPRIVLASKGGPEPKIAPLLAAAYGVAAGAGIQLAGQALRKAAPGERDELVRKVDCNLSCAELERIARQVLDDADAAKGSDLQAIADEANQGPPGAKPIPIAAAAFLAGVAAGAAAARP